MKRIVLGLASSVLVLSPVLMSGPAQASSYTWHGPYSTKAQCKSALQVYQDHGYTITQNCERSGGGLGNFWFETYG